MDQLAIDGHSLRKPGARDLDAARGGARIALVGRRGTTHCFAVRAGGSWIIGMSELPALLNLRSELGKTLYPQELVKLMHYAVSTEVSLSKVADWIKEKNPGFVIEVEA